MDNQHPNMSTQPNNWSAYPTEQAYRLQQAEFKGMTLQAMQDIRDDIKLMRDDIKEIKKDKNTDRYIAMLLGGLSGIISNAITQLKMFRM